MLLRINADSLTLIFFPVQEGSGVAIRDGDSQFVLVYLSKIAAISAMLFSARKANSLMALASCRKLRRMKRIFEMTSCGWASSDLGWRGEGRTILCGSLIVHSRSDANSIRSVVRTAHPRYRSARNRPQLTQETEFAVSVNASRSACALACSLCS